MTTVQHATPRGPAAPGCGAPAGLLRACASRSGPIRRVQVDDEARLGTCRRRALEVAPHLVASTICVVRRRLDHSRSCPDGPPRARSALRTAPPSASSASPHRLLGAATTAAPMERTFGDPCSTAGASSRSVRGSGLQPPSRMPGGARERAPRCGARRQRSWACRPALSEGSSCRGDQVSMRAKA